MNRVILASSSPERKRLLEQTGLKFEVIPSNFEEDMTQKIPPEELAVQLAKGKAYQIADANPDAVVIAADTFVVHNNKFFGKPHTIKRAVDMLTQFSGTSHDVITGYTILKKSENKEIEGFVCSRVYFKKLTRKQIYDYAVSGEPLEKAGSYAYAQNGHMLIDHIDGDVNNVMGFPTDEIIKQLEQFNIS